MKIKLISKVGSRLVFLDENDKTKTVEGYPAPKRVYVKARKVL